MSNYSLSLDENVYVEDSVIKLGSVITLLMSKLEELNVPTVYIGDWKAKDIQRQTAGICVLEEANTNVRIVGTHTYNEYGFVAHVYTKRENDWLFYDSVIKKDMVFKMINQPVEYGGVIVGYTANVDYTPTTRLRGIYLVDYNITVQVLY